MDKALVLADRLKKLKDQVNSLATKQTEIQTIKGDQGPKGEQGDRGFDGAPGGDGRDGKDGKGGADGKDGVSVVKAEIDFDGSLVLYLSNGDQIDCGEVTPEKSKEVFQTIKSSGGSSPINIFTAVLPGLVPASGGGTVNFLRADGTFAAPPSGAPASPSTSVQFNNAGAFGGTGTFTYNSGIDTLTVGNLVSANFTSAAQGLVPASGGGTSNFLRADGTFAAPPSGAPAGSDTQIQFNNAGVFGASANFTFNSTTNTVNLGATTGTATYTTRIPTTVQNPIALVVAAQNSIRTAGTSFGGALTLRSGNGRPTGAGGGGVLGITSGNAGTIGVGGALNITAGAGGTTSGDGGAITILGGNTTSGLGGVVTVQGGPGGSLLLNGGNNPNGNGGDVIGFGGQSAGSGAANGGSFSFSGGQANAALGGDGGGLFFAGGQAGVGNGGDCTFNNGRGNGVHGNIRLFLDTSALGLPGSILLNSSFGTAAIEITKNASTNVTEIGFFSAVPVARPAAVPVTAAGIHAALVSLGLIT